MTSTIPILSVENVTKQYPGAPAPVLQSMSFQQAEGGFLAIVGPSGCGKTTLLRAISGLLEVEEGQVLHRGERYAGPPPWLSIVFQDYTRSLFPWLTVRKNVEFGLKRLPKADRAAAAEEALEMVGLDHAMDLYPWQVSGGMQQRCSLARSLAARPSLLLLDEPFASVDAQTRTDLQDLVLRLTQELGLSTLLVTHDVEEAIYLSNRVVVLSSRPSQAVEEIVIDLPGERDQIATKELPEFLELRHHVHNSVRRETNRAKTGPVQIG